MSHPVISLERIRREAEAAALKHADVNDACPYPFGSDAGHAFKQIFTAARAAMTQPKAPV